MIVLRSTLRRALGALALLPAILPAQDRPKGWPVLAKRPAPADATALVPDPDPLVGRKSSELRDLVERYTADASAVNRRYSVDYSPDHQRRFRDFLQAWRGRLRAVAFDKLGQEGKIDYVLLDHDLRYRLTLLERDDRQFAEMAALVGFARPILDLYDARRRMEAPDDTAAARMLHALAKTADSLTKKIGAPARPDSARKVAATGAGGSNGGGGAAGIAHRAGPAAAEDSVKAPAAGDTVKVLTQPSKIVALRAANALDAMRRSLGEWYRFYAGYDPMFTWWVSDPYRRADDALKKYVEAVKEKVVGIKKGEDEPIVGDPIGADGLAADLTHEMLPYTPEELIAIAEREFAWCEAELKRASRDMGFGDDWKRALEKVKQTYVAPGDQIDLVRDMEIEAVDFITKRDLVTVPPLAQEIWRIEMLSPERQKVSPFFLGGEVLQVSFPTDSMAHDDKMMSMRGNNIHFSRATVHHEMIPGHHLQGFMSSRYNSHRRAFSTPFWTEGWALYWEMLLWDLDFPRSPEDRMGMLFWRTHRAARIIFSLKFHLGQMTPQEAIDFLVDRVGHERANATAEVRRSFNGSYSPLYQVAYMMGGLQFRALHRELVGGGKMTNRQFHDAILQGGNMPVEMVRARLTGAKLTREHEASWRFDGPR